MNQNKNITFSDKVEEIIESIKEKDFLDLYYSKSVAINEINNTNEHLLSFEQKIDIMSKLISISNIVSNTYEDIPGYFKNLVQYIIQEPKNDVEREKEALKIFSYLQEQNGIKDGSVKFITNFLNKITDFENKNSTNTVVKNKM